MGRVDLAVRLRWAGYGDRISAQVQGGLWSEIAEPWKCIQPLGEAMRTFRWVLIGALALMCFGVEVVAQQCGPLKPPGQYGPYDYWTDKERLPVVEEHHFNTGVETLTRGQEGTLGSDLDYTLRAFPNHPRALMAMMKLSVKEKTQHPHGAKYSVECYFIRALSFRPKDGMARMIYSNYLSNNGKNAEALKQLEAAEEVAGENGNMQYNLGLAYFEAKNYEKSLTAAHRAYALGFDLPGLKGKLVKAGKWREPAPPPVAIVSPAEAVADKKDEASK